VPVIGSQIGGIAEQVGSSQTDWLFPPGDPTVLAQRMSSVLSDPERLLQRTAAMDLMAAQVAPEHITRRYLDLYQMVLQ
jgi:glycogen synthase